MTLPVVTATPGDLVFPSDNELGIPALPLSVQATGLDAPLVQWGSRERRSNRPMRGTWGFYTDDYRFTSVWAAPAMLLTSQPAAVVEPNLSIFDQTPNAVAAWRTYQKRWLARWWAGTGVRIWVDLNVSESHAALNLLGVPRGWRAFATRGYTERLHDLEREHALAIEHGEGEATLLVYGGGEAVHDWCRQQANVVHVAEGKRIIDWGRVSEEANGKRKR